jgi:hypothetical protein
VEQNQNSNSQQNINFIYFPFFCRFPTSFLPFVIPLFCHIARHIYDIQNQAQFKIKRNQIRHPSKRRSYTGIIGRRIHGQVTARCHDDKKQRAAEGKIILLFYHLRSQKQGNDNRTKDDHRIVYVHQADIRQPLIDRSADGADHIMNIKPKAAPSPHLCSRGFHIDDSGYPEYGQGNEQV